MKFLFLVKILSIVILLIGLLNSMSCSSSLEAGTESFNTNQLITLETLEEYPLENINEDEFEGLIYLREEEKLARDVYFNLNNLWNRRVFTNISGSEQRHMDAIKSLLTRYELKDPIEHDSLGYFKNPILQDLYTTLIEQGNKSLVEALKVGALIEEVDILDIEHELNDYVDNQDITFVYQNLLKGSHNHLRAFVRNLSRQGIEYEPQKLSREQYLKIITDVSEPGRR